MEFDGNDHALALVSRALQLWGAMTSRTLAAMPLIAARFLKRLRASLLAFLVLGLVINPSLTFVSELHGADHAVATQADGHHHDNAGLHDGAPDSDHTEGTHGLLHQSSGGAFSDSVAVITLPAVVYALVMVALPTPLTVALQHLTGPFRPPIA